MPFESQVQVLRPANVHNLLTHPFRVRLGNKCVFQQQVQVFDVLFLLSGNQQKRVDSVRLFVVFSAFDQFGQHFLEMGLTHLENLISVH
jgi:hypothetical protein